jgi:iron(III) transport system substrate-binding protein
VAASDLLEPVPAVEVGVVPEGFRDGKGRWVGVGLTERVVVSNSGSVGESDVPAGVDAWVDSRWKGKVGFAKAGGVDDVVTALRVTRGQDAAAAWVGKLKANDPVLLESDAAVLDAVASGRVSVGVVGSDAAARYRAGHRDGPVRVSQPAAGDPAAVVNAAGVGMLKRSNHKDAARAFVQFLLSEEAQRILADEAALMPVRAGVTSTKYQLPPAADLRVPKLDLSDLRSTAVSRQMLAAAGLG